MQMTVVLLPSAYNRLNLRLSIQTEDGFIIKSLKYVIAMQEQQMVEISEKKVFCYQLLVAFCASI
jgi:hypothetical protein